MASALLTACPPLKRGSFELGRFANGEAHAVVSQPEEESVVLASVQPPDVNLVDTLLLCDTVFRSGGTYLKAVIPYLSYTRQDKPEFRKSLAVAWLGKLLAACGVSQVVTLDAHSRRGLSLLGIPSVSVPSATLLASVLKEFVAPEYTLVAPDAGAVDRRDQLAVALGMSHAKKSHCVKVRSKEGVTSRLVESVSSKALVVDDILDTGGTLIACCEHLRLAGVEEIVVAVTHGLFTGSAWQALWELGVTRIVCTDTVAGVRCPDPRVSYVACAPALAPAILAREQITFA